MNQEQTNEVINETSENIIVDGAKANIQNDWYEFDFDKVNTIDDIKKILSAMGMKFNQMAPNFEELKSISKKVD